MLPNLSASICTSTCLTFSRYFSRNNASSPKDAAASFFTLLNASSISDSALTILIPFPPPPALALSITGYPISAALVFAIATSSKISLPFMTGTPALIAILLAISLWPIFRITSASGPIKSIPFCSHIRANSGFSESIPYPG